jgi:Fels-1 Prophage Protein-like
MGAAMFVRRSLMMAIAALALVGCANGGYGGSYPNDAYYDGPYGGVGYDADYDGDSDRYFRPSHGITCDRSRDLCYDRYGPSYQATARYLGEKEANRAYKRYGDRVFLFSPKPGVTCDRRTQSCSNGNWSDRVYGDNTPFYGNDAPSRPQQQQGVGDRPGGFAAPGACPPLGCK